MAWIGDHNAALLTDLYELTMTSSYHSRRMDARATFDLFVRHLPEQRRFLVSAGLEQALHYLETLHFDDEAIAYLRSLNMFDASFLDRLDALRFTGEVWALPEGEVFFADEPIVSVTAPLIEAQMVETFLLNCITYQTMVASKAARVAIACRDKAFVDFSARRDHGADAALRAARASFIGGASATATVIAGKEYGIPLSGTMAHSYIMAFASEMEAFRAFAQDFRERTVLLIDTFDTEEGARKAARVAAEMRQQGVEIRGVRLDSGDLSSLSRSVRKILDDGGSGGMQIFASGDMDEYEIDRLVKEGAPIDAFGVGTRMGTSSDASSLGTVYKLVEDEAGPKMKLSTGKVTVPGCKQVSRVREGGVALRDIICLREEDVEGEPLMVKVMEGGRRTAPPEPLEDAQKRCREAVEALPSEARALAGDQDYRYEVRRSPRLDSLVRDMKAKAR